MKKIDNFRNPILHRCYMLVLAGVAVLATAFVTAAKRIVIGDKGGDLCRQFIKFVSDPKRQARFALESWYGPTHSDALKYIGPEQAKLTSTHPDNLRKCCILTLRIGLIPNTQPSNALISGR